MSLLRLIWDEIVAMFIDDGALAVQVAVLVAVAAVITKLLGVPALWSAALLIPGCMAILGASIMRAKKRG